jgi:hypothetical protein
VALETLTARMEELGLGFMSAGLVTFLGASGRGDVPLFDSIGELIDLEYTARMERMARTRLKLSGMPQYKRLDDFDLSWLKGGLPVASFEELKSLAFVERKENVVLLGPSA